MARTETVVLICDDPRHADPYEAIATRQLTVDGRSYELDLCGPHDKELTEALVPFTDHARRVAPERRHAKRSAESRQRSRDIRDWWQVHPQPGVTFTDRGRIPAPVKAAYARRG